MHPPTKPVSEMSSAELIEEARRRGERRRLGKPLAPTPVELEQREKEIDARLEKEIQAEVIKLYKAFGCAVYNLSQARASKQTPGLPDLVCFYEDQDKYNNRSFSWWHETKTPSGKQSDAQVEFQIRCRRVSVPYVLGGIRAAEEHLINFRLAERINGVLEPIRR
jgi:hypothetical protein